MSDADWAYLKATDEEVQASQDRFEALADTSTHACIVGAGLTGVEAAKVFAKEGRRPVVVLDRGAFMGGIWVSGANPESCVQVDPVSFAPVEEDVPGAPPPVKPLSAGGSPFESFAYNRRDVLTRLAAHAKHFDIKSKVAFGVEVLSFGKPPGAGAADPVSARLKLHPSGKIVEREFAEFHLRIGNLLRPQNLTFPGELRGGASPGFEGRSCFGVGGDIEAAEFAGRRVVVVGSGAFAVENVRRALAAGAAPPVVVLAREFNKCLFPEYVTYSLRHTLNSYRDPTQCQDDEEAAKRMWRRTAEQCTKVSTLCGMAEKTLNSKCIRTIDGEPHVLFNRGLPPLSSNLMFLAHYYGLALYEEDEVRSCAGRQVTTKKGATYPCDVLVKCVGFDHNDSILQDHVCNDAYFVDNQLNITHNCRGDRVNGTLIFGPSAQCRNFLISYYEDAQDYERPIVRMNQLVADPAALYQQMIRMEPRRCVCDISMVDYLTTIFLSDKIARLPEPSVQDCLRENLERRRDMYAKHLDDATYRELDGRYWRRLSEHFHQLSGGAKPLLDYPFA
ncbi:hypothetical protein DIPPA_15813 [Diplonema papillatum]|nr:hypothetical protein DIPPA_15813 [Diplonema papillatum]|eukprot:gene4565-7060_t